MQVVLQCPLRQLLHVCCVAVLRVGCWEMWRHCKSVHAVCVRACWQSRPVCLVLLLEVQLAMAAQAMR
jgi:hypothetical protein